MKYKEVTILLPRKWAMKDYEKIKNGCKSTARYTEISQPMKRFYDHVSKQRDLFYVKITKDKR